MLLSLREITGILGAFTAVTWLLGVTINHSDIGQNTAGGLEKRINVVNVMDTQYIQEIYSPILKKNLSEMSFDDRSHVRRCHFQIAITRSDHGNSFWKNISVSNQDHTETFQFIRCSTKGLEGERCVNNLKIASGVNVLVNRRGEEVGYGSCCNLQNTILARTPIHCNHGDSFNSTFMRTESNVGIKGESVDTAAIVPTRLSKAFTVGTNTPYNKETVKLKIFVLTYDRSRSLNRLLQSLSEAYYDKDGRTEEEIDLNIMIDIGKDAHQKHDAAVVAVAEKFVWRYGLKTVYQQPVHAGLSGQWIDSWRPYSSVPMRSEVGVGVYDTDANASDHTLAAMFEDDLVVSKYWWRWARAAHDAYGHRTDVAGYTLQRVTQNASGGRDLEGGPSGTSNFFYRLIGTWGVVFHPRAFGKFRMWFHLDAIGKIDPRIPQATKLNEWYDSFVKAGTEKDRFWSIWMDKFVDLHDYFFVYTKCRDRKTLASNMRESGLNFGGQGGRPDFPRLSNDYPDLYSFPVHPTRLSWNGQPISI